MQEEFLKENKIIEKTEIAVKKEKDCTKAEFRKIFSCKLNGDGVKY